jgi:hypothetical protein
LEEDEQVQRWDQEEERINAEIQDLKQRQKTMGITEHLKGTQEMKRLQAELKTTQAHKQERQAQMEPLQEKATEMITQLEAEKKNMAQTQVECTTMVQEEVTTQNLEALTEKVVQVQTRGRGLEDKFHSLAEAVKGARSA